MPLKFGNDFCTPCEPSARVWHKANDAIVRRPIAIIVMDVDLQWIPTPSACLTDTVSKHSTHSLRFNECAVASDKVVSARKEARSAHVEMLKMEVQEEGNQGRTAPKPGIPPTIVQLSHEVRRVLWSIFTCLTHVPGLWAFLTALQSSPRLRFSSCSVSRDAGSLFSVGRVRLSRRIIVD